MSYHISYIIGHKSYNVISYVTYDRMYYVKGCHMSYHIICLVICCITVKALRVQLGRLLFDVSSTPGARTQLRDSGVCPTLKCNTKVYSTKIHALVSGPVLLAAQGFDPSQLDMSMLTSHSCFGRLSGNAMTLSVVSAILCVALATLDFGDDRRHLRVMPRLELAMPLAEPSCSSCSSSDESSSSSDESSSESSSESSRAARAAAAAAAAAVDLQRSRDLAQKAVCIPCRHMVKPVLHICIPLYVYGQRPPMVEPVPHS